MSLRIETYRGERDALRPLFELAEDSARALESYLGAGRVIVARDGGAIIGHLQLTETGDPLELELKNMAVVPERQRTGAGRALVAEACAIAAREGRRRMIVATAAADLGNLRFYQRLGFRLRSIERDAFTAATGYPDVLVDGIPLRDRVWLDRTIEP